MIKVPELIPNTDLKNRPLYYGFNIVEGKLTLYANIEDSYDFIPDISNENILKLIRETSVVNGYISAQLSFILDENGNPELVIKNSDRYKKALSNSSISLRNIQEGEEVYLQNFDFPVIFLGTFTFSSISMNYRHENKIRYFVNLDRQELYGYLSNNTPKIFEKGILFDEYSNKSVNVSHIINSFKDFSLKGRITKDIKDYISEEDFYKMDKNKNSRYSTVLSISKLKIKD